MYYFGDILESLNNKEVFIQTNNFLYKGTLNINKGSYLIILLNPWLLHEEKHVFRNKLPCNEIYIKTDEIKSIGEFNG